MSVVFESMTLAARECKYHVVFIPKYHRRTLYKALRPPLRETCGELARRLESEVLERRLKIDRARMLLSIPPKRAVLQVMGFIKGKNAIHIAR